ncbi:11325_t:CDS:2, partial [Cetraspora pellucida]
MLNTTYTVGQDLFSAITKVLDKYLTEPIKNMIRKEMSQCLFVNANLIEPNYEELNREQENLQTTLEGFIEDQNDARFMTLQAMIKEVGQDCEKNNELMDKGILPTRKLATILATVPTIKKAVYKRNLYSRVWELA